MKKYIFAIISFILALISINTVYAATPNGWGFDLKRPTLANVYDCSSSNCNVSLNSKVENIDNSTFYYWASNQTNMSANGAGNMWAYLLESPLSKDYLYSITSYVCSLNYSANLVFKDYYSSDVLANVYNKVNKGTNYFSQTLNNLSHIPYKTSDENFGSCSYFTSIYKPSVNSKYVGINFTVDLARNNFASAFIGYKVDSLGLANNLSTSDIQNIISSSGLASSSDINSLNTSITNIQNQLSNNISDAKDNINNNTNKGINSVNDNLKTESENIQNGIKDGFEDCRDSYNLIDFSSPTNLISSTFTFTNDVLTINSNGSYSGISYNILSLLRNNIGKTIRFDFDSFNSSSSLSDIEIVLLINGSFKYHYIVNRSGSSSNFVIPSSVENASSAELTIYSNSSSQNIESSLTITKPIFHFGSSKIDYEKYGEKICKNRIDSTNEKLDDLNGTLNNSDTSGANSDANSFFSGFSSNDFGLSSIITMPLQFISHLTDNNTCDSLVLPLPFVNQNATLPCMTSIYNTYFHDFLVLYQTITTGFISYWVCINIFRMVQGFKNPESDQIEVMDL